MRASGRQYDRPLSGAGVAATIVLLAAATVCAHPAATAHAPTRSSLKFLPYGTASLDIPCQPRVNQTSSRTVALLGEALRREGISPPRRVEIVRDLAACQLRAALPYIVTAMADREAMVRAEAARAVAATAAEAPAATDAVSVLPALKRLLADRSPDVRREAILAGTALGDPSFALAGLTDAEPGVVLSALRAARTDDHARIIAAKLVSWPPSLRVEALRALGRSGSAQHTDAIAVQLSGPLEIKVAALEVLGTMRATTQLRAVQGLLTDAHPSARRAAVAAMAGVGSIQEQHAVVRRVLSDPGGDADATVREAAVRLLSLHPGAQMTPLLAGQLSTDYGPLHEAVRDALVAAAANGVSDVVPLATALLVDANPRRQQDASYLLGRLRSDESLGKHIALLRHKDLEVVAQAAWSLGEIGSSDAGPALTDVVIRTAPLAQSLGDRRESANQASRACEAAIVAIGRIDHRPALAQIKPLIMSNGSRSNLVRAAAVWAFGVLGEPSDDQACQLFLRFYADPYESQLVKFEGLKAMGNLRYLPALPGLESIRRSEPSNPLRWAAASAHDRITGAQTPYEPPPITWSADVSREDRPD
jgi:HEAT repeat protein